MIVETVGIGYFLNISYETYNIFKDKKEAFVFTHLQFINDRFNLYGFSSKRERELFYRFINIDGIGPKLAIRLFSQDSYRNIENYILNEDVKSLTSLNGLGLKTAQKIMLELKGKIISHESSDTELVSVHDAVFALQELGFEPKKVEKVVKEIARKESDLEKIIKEALKVLK